jgi:hypothetical protein
MSLSSKSRRLLGAAGLLLAASLGARAQAGKFHFHAGYGVVLLRSTGPSLSQTYGSTNYGTYELQTVNTPVLLANAGLGFDAPLLPFGQGEHALGVSLNAQFGIMISQVAEGFSRQTIFDFPEYLTYRYGAKASKHAKHPFGVGVGGGYRFSRFFLPFRAPSALLEGVYSSQDVNWFLRLTADLQPTRFYNYASSQGPVEVLNIREVNIQIGRSF